MVKTPSRFSTPTSTPQTRTRFQTSTRTTRHSGPPTVARTASDEATEPQPFVAARNKRFELLCIAIETNQMTHARALLETAVDASFEIFMAQKKATIAHFEMGFHTARAGLANIGIELLNCLSYELKILKILQTEQEGQLESSDVPTLFNAFNPPSHPFLTAEAWIEEIKLIAPDKIIAKYKIHFDNTREEYIKRARETPTEMQSTVAARSDIATIIAPKITSFQETIHTDFSWEALTENNLTATLARYATLSADAEEGVYKAMSETLEPLVESLNAQHQTAQRARAAIHSLTSAADTLHPQVLRLMPAISIDAKSCDEFGNLLHRAVRAGHKSSIKLCLQAGIPLDAVDKDGKTPLEITDGNGNNILHCLMKTTDSLQDDDEHELISDADAIKQVLAHYYQPRAAAGAGAGSTAVPAATLRPRQLFQPEAAYKESMTDLHFQTNKEGHTPLDFAVRNLYETWSDHERTKLLIHRIVLEMQSVFHYLSGKLNKYEEGSKDYRTLQSKKHAIERAIATMAQKTEVDQVLRELETLKENATICRKRSSFSSKTSQKISHIYHTLKKENRSARIHPETLSFPAPKQTSYQSTPGIECAWFHQFKNVQHNPELFRTFRDKALGHTDKAAQRRLELRTQHGAKQEYPLQFAARLACEKRQETQTLSIWFVRVYAAFADAIRHVSDQLKKANTRSDYENLTQKSTALLAQQETSLQELNVNALAPTAHTSAFWRTIKTPRRHPEDERVENTATAKHLARSARLLV